MTHDTHKTLVLLLAVLASAVLCAGAATAQELPGERDNATEQNTDLTNQLGDLAVHDYSYDNGEMTVTATWRGSTPTTVTMTEMIELDSAGSTKISFKTIRLVPGSKTEIDIAAEQNRGTAAVQLTTPESLENNDALVLQAGDPGTRAPIPFGTASILIGAAAIAGAGLAFAFTAREHEDGGDAERRERLA
ncbi:hypothetical protein Hrd1104_00060 [Halorhabdus sp. CBA1104]|uniref:hypothetical protein n=1 Tax=Halorhabdus sp. CBA1104 TaxID=1380432 RepID=UPI0012B264F4|nr:hypothetical protein [Halorhabdus sp. CBA1104]QGN05839.1 hypothetical protein Hrd1104_00060 [Halorhabdus sp. CBA1104]